MRNGWTTVSVAALATCLGMGPVRAQESSGGGDAEAAQAAEPAQDAGGDTPPVQQSAQSQEGGGAETGEKQPGELTCAEVSALDAARIPGMLYFIAGYDQGLQPDGQTGSGAQAEAEAGAEGSTGEGSETQAGGAAEGASDDPTVEAEATAGGAAGAEDASQSAASDGSGSDDAVEAAPMTTGEGPATGAPGDASEETMEASEGGQDPASGSGGGAENEDPAASGGDGEMGGVRVAGFYSIPIEKSMIACGQSPDRRAGDVIREQQQSMGADG